MTACEFVHVCQTIKSCDRCSAHDNPPAKPLASNAGTGVRVAVVMGSFGIPGEKLLRALIREQFDESEVCYTAAKLCSGPTARTDHCRSHLEATLYAMPKLQLVLLVGGEGLNVWRPDQTLKNHQGYIGALLQRWFVMPIPHPDSVIKGYESRVQMRTYLRDAVELLAYNFDVEMCKQFKSKTCGVSTCNAQATQWDVDGVGYCEPKHWKKYGGQWKKVRKEWDKMKFEGTQVRLAL